MTLAGTHIAAVLMYHSVCGAQPSLEFEPYVVSPTLLDRQLAALAEAGFAVGSSVHLAKSAPKPRSVVLTFDDGFRDFHDVVLPILERHRMRASLFVPTGYLGGTALWLAPDGEDYRPIIDAAQLRYIATSGLVDIGAHSHAHPPLDLVDAARRRAEIRLPRLILEDLIQAPVRTFAYPFGYYNGGARRDVAAAGYDLAYAVGERHVTSRDHHLAIPRWRVGAELAPEALVRLVLSDPAVGARAISGTKRHVWRQHLRLSRLPVAPPAHLPAMSRHHPTAELGQ